MASEPTPEQSYCADQARRNDWDRFICALFAPREARETLFALIAFNSELARTRALVSEPLLGQIRLQWWRDAIAAIYGDTPATSATANHPILAPLARAIAAYSLNRAPFEAMIDARSDELDDDGFATVDSITAHVEATSGNLARLQIAIIGQGVNPSPVTIRATDEVSIAWGFVELMRGGRIPHEHADQVAARLDAARALIGEVDRRFFPVLLPATLAQSYLKRPHANRVRRQIRLAYDAFRGKF